ncbi:MAG: SMC-Scp complex subunit ScpB [Candidatus ainarchaeum sp.]|nr:SMC-Scp complex subunit ScpB [Candidatus ainarchaeum sp.]
MKEEKKLIEAALFISGRSMTLEEIRTLTGIGALGYLQSVIEELKSDYEARNSGLEISGADGKYEMRVRAEMAGRVKQFAQEAEISKSALRTLAYLSKHDGILKSQLVKRIGTKVYGDVQELVESGFVKSQKAGRSSKLTLTEKFRKYFVQAQQPEETPQQTLPAVEEQPQEEQPSE